MAWASSSTPRSSSFPFRVRQPGAVVAGADGQLHLLRRVLFVEFAVGVAGQGDHPGEHGERVRFGELAVFDQQVLHQVPGVRVHRGWQAGHGAHDGPGLFDADGPGGERVGQSGQHRRGVPAADIKWLREDGAGGGDPGGGVVRGDVQGAAEQRGGVGVAVRGGDPAGVDLPGELELRGEGEPGDAFQGGRECQQRGLVELREFGVGQGRAGHRRRSRPRCWPAPDR